MIMKYILYFIFLVLISGCVTTHTSSLPEEKYTTSDIILGTTYDEEKFVHYTINQSLDLVTNQASSTTRAQIEDLNRDFQRVPNPEIFGFVYPHMSGDVPIPGYGTVFKLYKKEHYAIRNEGFLKKRQGE